MPSALEGVSHTATGGQHGHTPLRSGTEFWTKASGCCDATSMVQESNIRSDSTRIFPSRDVR